MNVRNTDQSRAKQTFAWTPNSFKALVTVLLLIILALHLSGVIKIDGYAIALLILAILPWTYSTWNSIFDVIGEAFRRSEVRSFEVLGVKIERLERKADEHDQKLDEQRRLLDDLIVYSMAFYVYKHLKYIYLGAIHKDGPYGDYRYVRDEAFDHDLRYLRDHGYLEMFYLDQLTPGENLVGKLKVTEMGQRFVELNESRQHISGDRVPHSGEEARQ